MRKVLFLIVSFCAFFLFSNDAHALMFQQQNQDESFTEAFNNSETDSVNGTSLPSKPLDASFVKPNTSEADYALQLAKGKRYVWGGNSDTEVDCSSFSQQFIRGYKGIHISRTTYDQVKEGTPVSNPQPGDLVFFNDYAHVGVYVGDGMMVDALNPEEGVGLRAVSYVHGKVDGYFRY